MQQKPISQDDIFRARHVVDGVLAPDGSCAVFVVSETERAADPVDDTQRTSLWRIGLTDGAAQRLTARGAHSMAPRFAPDSASIFFLSARDLEGKDNQIFRLPMEGGEAEPLTRMPGGVTAFSLSPDGLSLACVSSGKTPKPRGPRDHVRIDRVIYRFDPLPGYLQDFPQAIFVLPTQGGEPKQVVEADGLISALCWSPNSKNIAFIRVAGKSIREFGHGDLCVVEPGQNERVLLTHGLFQLPFWSGNGETIGVSAPPENDFTRQAQVHVVSSSGGDPTSRTRDFDSATPGLFQTNSPAARFYGIARVPDGEQDLFIGVAKGGEGQIARIALTGPQRIQSLIVGERICKLVDVRAGKILFTAQNCNQPSELFIANLDGSGELQLTNLNGAWQAEFLWPRVEHLKVSPEPRVEIETWALIPKHARAPYPTILYLHGGPHAAFGWSYNEDMQELAGAGYAVVFPNPRGSVGYGDAFSGAIVGQWGQRELGDLEAVLNELVSRGIADPKRIGVTGVSGGGHLAACLITHSQRFAAAVPEQGVYNMFSMYGVSDCGPTLVTKEMAGLPHERAEVYWNLSPVAHAHTCRTPTLLIQGEHDVRCPMQQAEEFFIALKRGGCVAELLRLNCNHGIQMVGPPHLRRYRMDAIKDWFGRYMA